MKAPILTMIGKKDKEELEILLIAKVSTTHS